MSPIIGVLSSVFCTSSRINPPITTVWPSYTLTLVVTLRVLNTGWLMTFGVRRIEFELDNLWNQIEIDCCCVPTNHWFDFQGYTSISRLPILRCRGRDDDWNG